MLLFALAQIFGSGDLVSFQRVLIAVDSEPLASHAAELGIELAASLGAEVAFVHAIDPALTQATGITPAELIAEYEWQAKRLIGEFSKLVRQTSPPLEFIHVGKPASEIVRTAQEWRADIVVIGSHARHGVQRALLGSVAEAVMRHAPCPVFVVRAKA
jgi:nucleotide-binding universal stress UspA family protein